MLTGSDNVDQLLNTVGPGRFGIIGVNHGQDLASELRKRGSFAVIISGIRSRYNRQFSCIILPRRALTEYEMFVSASKLSSRYIIILTPDSEADETFLQNALKCDFQPSVIQPTLAKFLVLERTQREATSYVSDTIRDDRLFISSITRFIRKNDKVLVISSEDFKCIDFITARTTAASLLIYRSEKSGQSKYRYNSSNQNIELSLTAREAELNSKLTNISVVIIADVKNINYFELQLVANLLRPDGRLIFKIKDIDELNKYNSLIIDLKTIFVQEKIMTYNKENRYAVILSKNPLNAKTLVPYNHPNFDHNNSEIPDFINFAKFYENPWIYRSLIQMGERIENSNELINLCRHVINSSTFNSADFGAALAVLGYDLRSGDDLADEPAWRTVAHAYIKQTPANLHVTRWQISLLFLAGLLSMKKGFHSRALADFRRCLQYDALVFSPLLSTKTIGAAFWAGTILISKNKLSEAQEFFYRGVEIGRAALHANDFNAIGNPNFPLDFGFQELAEVADAAGQCALALNNLHLAKNYPGTFWSRINIKRFGLTNWLSDLHKENIQLRGIITRYTSENLENAHN